MYSVTIAPTNALQGRAERFLGLTWLFHSCRCCLRITFAERTKAFLGSKQKLRGLARSKRLIRCSHFRDIHPIRLSSFWANSGPIQASGFTCFLLPLSENSGPMVLFPSDRAGPSLPDGRRHGSQTRGVRLRGWPGPGWRWPALSSSWPALSPATMVGGARRRRRKMEKEAHFRRNHST